MAIPAVTTLGSAGILSGPAGIGFVAQLSSLSTAFLCMAVLLAVAAAGARTFRHLA